MNHAGKGSHEWRALKHFWKLLLTPASQLKYDNYWLRRNFGYVQLTDVEVVHRLLNIDEFILSRPWRLNIKVIKN